MKTEELIPKGKNGRAFPRLILPADDPVELASYKGSITEIYAHDDYQVQRLAAEGFVPALVVDIGAQIGAFTTLAANLWPQAKIYSFEAMHQHFRGLAANCTPRCRAINLPVLGDQDAQMNIDGKRYFDVGEYFFDAAWLADLLKNYPNAHTLLKIDCEGAEGSILPRLMEYSKVRFEIITGEWHQSHVKKIVIDTLSPFYDLKMNEPPPGGGNYSTFFAKLKR